MSHITRRSAEQHARDMIARTNAELGILRPEPAPDQPVRQICSTTDRIDGDGRRDHASVAEARQRAADLAAHIARHPDADLGVERLTIWIRSEVGAQEWTRIDVIDLRKLAGLDQIDRDCRG